MKSKLHFFEVKNARVSLRTVLRRFVCSASLSVTVMASIATALLLALPLTATVLNEAQQQHSVIRMRFVTEHSNKKTDDIIESHTIAHPTKKINKSQDEKIIEKQTIKTSTIKSVVPLVDESAKPLVENKKPPYPRQAKIRGIEGTVLLQLNINKQGEVSAIKILKSSGFSILDTAAEKAIKKWLFSPAKRGALTVASQFELPVIFRIQG